MKYYDKNPNTTVLIPSYCNANCGFCFWNRDKKIPSDFNAYADKLIESLDSIYTPTISISGGEPTMFDHKKLVAVLYILKSRTKKMVLNTNGFRLYELLQRDDVDRDLIQHINISRHAIDEAENIGIFNTDSIPEKEKLIKIISLANTKAIDVNCNFVYQEDDEVDIIALTNFCKEIGFSSLSLRKDIFQKLDISKCEKDLINSGYKALSKGGCPVCGQNTYIINRLTTIFKYGVMETADYFEDDVAYENIIHQNGELSHYWDKIELKESVDDILYVQPLSSCGGTYRCSPVKACGGGCGQSIETPSCGGCGRGYFEENVVNNMKYIINL